MAEMRAPVTRLPVPAPPIRPEYLRDVVAGRDIGVVQKPLDRLAAARQSGLAAEGVHPRRHRRRPGSSTRAGSTTRCWCRPSRPRSRRSGPPSPAATSRRRCRTRCMLLLKGYALGLVAGAWCFTALAMMFQLGNDLLETLTSAFNPLPAIALLPLALIWFGLGDVSIIFVLVHSVLWAVALNTHSGFRSVSNTLRMVGRNYGLRGIPLRRQDPDPRRLPLDPHRPQDRLGVRLAHADRRRAGVRRLLRQGRARLVHLREQEHARHPRRVRRPVHGDPDRPDGREPDLPQHRGGHRAPLGHAVLMLGVHPAKEFPSP